MSEHDPLEAVILDHFHCPDDKHQTWWIRPAEMAAAIRAALTEENR